MPSKHRRRSVKTINNKPAAREKRASSGGRTKPSIPQAATDQQFTLDQLLNQIAALWIGSGKGVD